MKILLVEDSATIRYAMCMYIEAAGHETVLAESGEQALQILDTTPVDMVIMDVEMPGLDGFETTRLIREWLGEHWIPIIFVTGKSEASSLEEGIAAGGDDYLIKPVNQIILNAKIKAMERITEMRDQLAKLNKELTVLSQRDGLTKLYNRRTFEEKAKDLWHQATRNKTPMTILLLDIDHFKLYNDCYGHPAGDECIRQVAEILEKRLGRSADLVARYGGEEFVAALPNTHSEGAGLICQQICENVEAMQIRHRDSSVSAYVTVSVGASVINYTTSTTLADQIEQADKALYESKSKGRNRYTIKEFNPQSRVLIVDESETEIDQLTDDLSGHCSVIQTSRQDECVYLAEEYAPELILICVNETSDILETCKELKNNPQTQSIPLVLVSSMDKSKLKTFGKGVHANGCLVRPFNRNRLIATVDQYLH